MLVRRTMSTDGKAWAVASALRLVSWTAVPTCPCCDSAERNPCCGVWSASQV